MDKFYEYPPLYLENMIFGITLSKYVLPVSFFPMNILMQ